MKKIDLSDGFLCLFLMVFLIFSLRPLFNDPGPQRLGCDKPFFIQVEGEIPRPGVYPFCPPITVKTLTDRAGRPPGASFPETQGPVNLPPGRKIIVKREGRGYTFSVEEMSGFHKLTLGIPLSLNNESEEGLTAISGIGPGLARAIVRERARRGRFGAVEEILDIGGISQGLFRKISPHLAL